MCGQWEQGGGASRVPDVVGRAGPRPGLTGGRAGPGWAGTVAVVTAALGLRLSLAPGVRSRMPEAENFLALPVLCQGSRPLTSRPAGAHLRHVVFPDGTPRAVARRKIKLPPQQSPAQAWWARPWSLMEQKTPLPVRGPWVSPPDAPIGMAGSGLR